MIDMLNGLFDPYERKARLFPGLLVALPILVPLVCTFGAKNATLVAVIGVLSTCGVAYALASLARGRGKVLEERLCKKWGGMPTTIALRHRETHLDSVTKQRYHDDIRAKLGIALPTPEEESADNSRADDAYIAATRRLRELTRNNKSLLFKENIAYGFHRNMLAMKAPGILTSNVGLLYGLVIAGAIVLRPPSLQIEHLADPGLAGGLTLTISAFLLLAWLFYFNADKVRRLGFAYADRLFEQLSSLPKKAAVRTRKTDDTAPRA